LKGSAGGLALITQHPSEHTPSAIEHGFRHPRLDQLLSAHIANDDILIGIDDPTAKLVTGILPTAVDAAMESPDLPQMAASLQPTQLGLGLAVEA
jgi:hypothetical protein